MSSDRLYYNDSYLTAFQATVAETDSGKTRIRLGHSAFYPTSGGQPFDSGTIAGIPVTDVYENDEGRVVHVLEQPLPAPVGAEVECIIDAERRFDHVQQHTGQHLLSAVLAELAKAPTLSFHMGSETSTIELGVAALDAAMLEAVEKRCNRLVAENRSVMITYEDAASVQDLRKASERQGTLRIVTIEGLDRSACGGTHVRSTGEIGCILLRGTEKIRGNVRLEFVCGLRAVRRARADFHALTSISRTLSAALDDTPSLVATLSSRVSDAEKQRSRISTELAAYRGRESFAQTPLGTNGLRVRIFQFAALTDEVRAEAQAFVAAGKGAMVAWCVDPASVLLSCSADSGLNAGAVLKPLLTARGGRGGGSANIAQGSVPGDVSDLVRTLTQQISQTGEPR